MIRAKRGGRRRPWRVALVEESPLRRVDPRAKLALSLCASLAVMLPLEKLVAFLSLYGALLLWARLLPAAAWQVWRLKWILVVLFAVDWVFVSLELAAIVCLRLILLAGAFALFFSTTTPGELRLALEWMRVPYRYAFGLSLAFQSVDLLDEEWRAVLEAQRARGAYGRPGVEWRQSETGGLLTRLSAGWGALMERVRDMVALAVPAIVLTTRRAWAMTEAAYARGFDSPHRRPYRRLAMGRGDWILLVGAAAVIAGLMLWKGIG